MTINTAAAAVTKNTRNCRPTCVMCKYWDVIWVLTVPYCKIRTVTLQNSSLFGDFAAKSYKLTRTGAPYFKGMWILIIKPTSCTDFSNLFWNETLHVSDSSSVNHQEFFTVHTTMVYVIQVCWQLSGRIRMGLRGVTSWSCPKAVYKPVWHYHCCVNSEKLLMMDTGTVRNM
jgi:hypothetical protein